MHPVWTLQQQSAVTPAQVGLSHSTAPDSTPGSIATWSPTFFCYGLLKSISMSLQQLDMRQAAQRRAQCARHRLALDGNAGMSTAQQTAWKTL